VWAGSASPPARHDRSARDVRDVPLLPRAAARLVLRAITSVNQALGALGRIQEVLDLPTETACDAEVAASDAVGADADLTGPPDAVTCATRDARPSSSAACISPTPTPSSRPPQRRAEAAAPRRRPRRRRGRAEAAARCCAACRSACRAARASPWSGRRARQVDDARAHRALRPDEGAVLLDGVDVRASTARDCARSSATSSRMPRPSPARSATTCGSRPRGIRRRLRARAARGEPRRRAGALAARLDAPVGEAGVMLSGGERQRLAIARALLAAPRSCCSTSRRHRSTASTSSACARRSTRSPRGARSS
jgi:ATP-binding cassette subfamily B protein